MLLLALHFQCSIHNFFHVKELNLFCPNVELGNKIGSVPKYTFHCTVLHYIYYGYILVCRCADIHRVL